MLFYWRERGESGWMDFIENFRKIRVMFYALRMSEIQNFESYVGVIADKS